MRQLIHALKYDRIVAAAVPIAHFMIAYLQTLDLAPRFAQYALVPIPLHFDRERERGFNQASLLAEKISETLHIPLLRALRRIRATDAQATMKEKSSRATNVANCFALSSFETVRGRHIILVDDVTTSGSTLREAAHVLRAGGARSVIALVAAQAR